MTVSRPPFCSVLRLAAATWLLVAACPGTRAAAQATAPAAGGAPTLDSLVAPIALYPDALVANILPASTYPVQVVEAARDTAGGAKPSASQMSQWDTSVQALVAFPSVLAMMSNQLDWTTELGQAVAKSQSAVMAAVQRVRAEAMKAGNLQSNDKQTVTQQGSTIIIEPANPQVIYVPQYNPVTIIEPAPAYAMAPAGYGMMTFGLGFAAGALTAYSCNWGHESINVNNNYNYTNVNDYHHATVNSASYSSWKAPTTVGHISTGPGPVTGGSGLDGARDDGDAERGSGDTGRDDDDAGRGADGDLTSGAASRGAGSSPDRFGGGDDGMFGGANGGGWAARNASDRGAQSLGDAGLGRGFGSFRGAGGSFRSGGHPRF